jgi:ParB-like nuclease domain
VNDQQGRVRGSVQTIDLDKVKPNDWNPNEVPAEVMESIRYGFRTDGWIASQALLVWGTDDEGVERNVIIDGEHRWRAARDVGIEAGPAVFLTGVSEVEAKQLTIKLNQKRGDWNQKGLQNLLHDLEIEGVELSALSLGFSDGALMSMLAIEAAPLDVAERPAPGGTPAPQATSAADTGGAGPVAPQVEQSSVRMVQLFLDDTTQPVFLADVHKLADEWGTKNVTDTVLEAIRRARATQKPSA